MTSKYLAFLVILVVSYGVSINLVEGIWKDSLKKVYTTPAAYTIFMGNFQAIQSVFSIIFMLIGGYILRNVSWKLSAMLTPIVISVTGSIFLAVIIFTPYVEVFFQVFGLTALGVAVFFGTLQNILSKSTKYSLFDSTKEMAYIPLSQDLKTKGKAAVDVLGGRLGKSAGGFIQSTVFIVLPNADFRSAAPFFSVIFALFLFIWFIAINGINREYEKKIR